VVEINEIIVANTISPLCFRLAQERGRKTKTTKLMAEWENEWDKVEVVLHVASGCPREAHLIRETAPLGLDPNPWLGYFTIVRS
ncbi:hypothetical protein H5410_021006, partial [Solanum commersonii]